MVNYSFIIPHKNTPDLLQKCLDSIPRRDDVQIIVVDDNSDEDKVDFEHFPGLDDPMVEVYLTKEGRGAGYARNIGMSHAVGKWLVFADADDFFNLCISQALDSFTDVIADVVFLKSNAIKLLDNSISLRGEELNRRVDIALKTGDYTLALLYSSPCQKFFCYDFLKSNHIFFNEVRWGNDVVFMAKVARSVRVASASPLPVYCITESEGSLVANKSLESRLVRYEEERQSIKILRSRFPSEESLYYWFFYSWFEVYKQNKKKAMELLPSAINAGGWGFMKQMVKAKFS